MIAEAEARRSTAVSLEGARILVVEDEALIALSIEQTLRDFGCTVVALAMHIDDALPIAQSGDVDAAMLDVNVGGREVFPVADVLIRRRIPVLFATGYGAEALRSDLRGRPIIRKPFQARELRQALERALSSR